MSSEQQLSLALFGMVSIIFVVVTFVIAFAGG
jgi:hypothetical protein